MLLDIIREQDLEIRQKYLDDFKICISEISQDQKLSAFDYSRALAKFDAQKPNNELDHLLARGFNSIGVEIKMRALFEKDKFIQNLSRGILYKGPIAIINELT